jgi:hypothetical protein
LALEQRATTSAISAISSTLDDLAASPPRRLADFGAPDSCQILVTAAMGAVERRVGEPDAQDHARSRPRTKPDS